MKFSFKLPSIWFKDNEGHDDPLLTFSFLAVLVILFKLLFAGAVLTIGKWLVWTVGGADAATITACWTPTLVAYVTNKYVKYNYHPDYIKMKKDIDGDGDEEEIIVDKNDVKEEKKP